MSRQTIAEQKIAELARAEKSKLKKGFILISSAILVVLPVDQVTGLTGLTDTARVAGAALIGPTAGGMLGSLVALCLCIAAIGTVSRLDGDLRATAIRCRPLPSTFGTLHPKYATPHVSVITLGVATAALIILGSMGGTAQQIYRIFISLEIVVYFIPFMYMFAALIAIQRQAAP